MILLRQQRDAPEWNASMAPYWESLPGAGGSITKENMPTGALHLLQDPVLQASIIVHGAYTRNVYEGGKPALIESFAEELPGVTLEWFQHLTSVVGPWYFWACSMRMWIRCRCMVVCIASTLELLRPVGAFIPEQSPGVSAAFRCCGTALTSSCARRWPHMPSCSPMTKAFSTGERCSPELSSSCNTWPEQFAKARPWQQPPVQGTLQFLGK